ncbi:FecR family protein [Aquiflexum sp. LQ15W]|uniref:FecR family protein n=1 Tax=Cognataquiflexum nitidum TaxID=2922272 RepID=UPI001F12BB46|nr:FecR family protein [Cognataquiflexum nitidum]MCH6201185.1 FecR family protein [Cognataquiflexum nitidum]
MEKFDKIIKDKLLSFPTVEKPNEDAVSNMMDLLDQELPLESKTRVFHPIADAKKPIHIVYKIAASLTLIVISLYALIVFNEITVEVGKMAFEKVELPDRSVVNMNADSRIVYNKFLWNFRRKVTFEGEGFFEIQKGEKFEIHSTLGLTQILGTSFNIYSRPGKYEVECLSGKVAVTSNATQKKVVLLPGDGVAIVQSDLQSYSLSTSSSPTWLMGEYYFEEENVEDVISELERQFDLEISFPKELRNQKYTGYFDNKDLDKALKLICEPLGLQYVRNGNLLEFTFTK